MRQLREESCKKPPICRCVVPPEADHSTTIENQKTRARDSSHIEPALPVAARLLEEESERVGDYSCQLGMERIKHSGVDSVFVRLPSTLPLAMFSSIVIVMREGREKNGRNTATGGKKKREGKKKLNTNTCSKNS